MKVRYVYNFLIIMFLFCCIFNSKSFANDTTLSIDVVGITVKGNQEGYYLVDGQKYVGENSFFRQKGDSIIIVAVPDKLCRLKDISCVTDGIVVLKDNSVIINSIISNVEINFEFAKRSSSGTEESDNDCQNCSAEHFIDVDIKEWYHEDIDYVYNKEIMRGVSENEFEPHTPTTRAMIVTMLYRIENEPNIEYENVFDDVETNEWYTDAVCWSNQNNIVLGYGNGKFGPHDDVTREQMITILWRYANYKKHNIKIENSTKLMDFDDVDDISEWAKDAMLWACSEEIIRGSNGLLMPQNSTERCQIAAILHRFCEN